MNDEPEATEETPKRAALSLTMAPALLNQVDAISLAERRSRSTTIEILLEAALAARADATPPA